MKTTSHLDPIGDKTKVEHWITSHGFKTAKPLEVLAGDGSQRTFYRLTTPEGTYIVLSDPEWILSKDYAPHQAFLSEKKIPVPRFPKEDPGSGILVMEDLGDELLQLRIAQKPGSKGQWLEQAVDILADLHGRTFPVPKTLPVSTRSFDATKYSDELGFTFEHLTGKYLGMPSPNASGLKAVKSWCEDLAKIRPMVFSHRDYHCRNILVKNEKLFLIDFQDARLGPPHYDLASLVFDAYVPMTDAERNSLLERYQKKVATYALGKEIDWNNFKADLSRVAFQRVVKAAGSFASFFTRYGKDTHLRYLVPALKYAANLSQQGIGLSPEASRMFDLASWIKLAEEKSH